MIGTVVSRYRILAKLGEGGMGVVFEAEDVELGRRVAVKFLPQQSLHSPEALERFRREARAASALNHPNICAVYDLGVHEGRPFLVMERMRGRTLREVIDRGELTIERVVVLGEQIAAALDAAHRAGIVHRDLKPTNLFVTDEGEAKVLDFGVAKQSRASEIATTPTASYAPTPAGDARTSTGTVLGTVQYMSPEQARGLELDERSDLFALGVVLYEMATGERPFRGDSAAEHFAELLKSEPVAPRRLNPSLPAALDELIVACLEKDPRRRCQSAAEARAVLRDLGREIGLLASSSERRSFPLSGHHPRARRPLRRRPLVFGLALAALVLLAAAAVVAVARLRAAEAPAAESATARAPRGAKRIVVLPFESVGAAGDAYFADGVADEVRSKLSGLAGLSVIARGSSNEYRDRQANPAVVARELDVRYLLGATVRWQKSEAGSRIRVTPELVEVAGGAAPVTLWQETFDGDLDDVFAVQSRIATAVAGALELELGAPQTARIEERPTSSLAAWDAYLKGREIDATGFDAPTQRDAAAEFERAVALDPGFALAWAWLSSSYSLAFTNGNATPEVGEAARAAAERAMALAPRRAESYWALGVYRRNVARDNAGALEITRRGLELEPENPDLLRILGYAEINAGRLAEAVEAQRKAVRVDPRSFRNQHALADSLLRLHRPREAREAADRALALNPSNAVAVYRRAVSFLAEGDLEGARRAVSAAPAEIDRAALVAQLAGDGNVSWLLDVAGRELLLRLTPAAYDGDEPRWADALADELWLRGDVAAARRHAGRASDGYRAELARGSDDPLVHAYLGATLAILGERDAAESEARTAVERASASGDRASASVALSYLVLTRIRLGDVSGALEALSRLVAEPFYVTPGWLRVDPTLDPLRGDARFRELARGTR